MKKIFLKKYNEHTINISENGEFTASIQLDTNTILTLKYETLRQLERHLQHIVRISPVIPNIR